MKPLHMLRLVSIVTCLVMASFALLQPAHARVVFGRLDVEIPDAGMGIRAAKEGGMQRAHHGDIIDVPPQSLNECWVFTTFDAITDQFWKHGSHNLLLWHRPVPSRLAQARMGVWNVTLPRHRQTAALVVSKLVAATIHQAGA